MDVPIEWLAELIAILRTHPFYSLAAGAAACIGYRLLQRKSRLQREADAHLAVLGRDKANRYGEVRPPR